MPNDWGAGLQCLQCATMLADTVLCSRSPCTIHTEAVVSDWDCTDCCLPNPRTAKHCRNCGVHPAAGCLSSTEVVPASGPDPGACPGSGGDDAAAGMSSTMSSTGVTYDTFTPSSLALNNPPVEPIFSVLWGVFPFEGMMAVIPLAFLSQLARCVSPKRKTSGPIGSVCSN